MLRSIDLSATCTRPTEISMRTSIDPSATRTSPTETSMRVKENASGSSWRVCKDYTIVHQLHTRLRLEQLCRPQVAVVPELVLVTDPEKCALVVVRNSYRRADVVPTGLQGYHLNEGAHLQPHRVRNIQLVYITYIYNLVYATAR